MAYSDLIKRTAKQSGISQKQARRVIASYLAGLRRVLDREGRARIRNFGSFLRITRKPREARNPRTGERILVPTHTVLNFHPASRTRQRLERS